MSERLDKAMQNRALIKSRSQASMLIRQGDVLVNGKPAKKPSQMVEESDQIEIKTRNIYVGRGAFKLVHGIEEFKLDFSNKVIADCGASTGGFTQVSLQKGASKVYAIDVGHDQLDSLLKNDSKVINLEGVNLKNKFTLAEPADFCVVDLSFISLKLVYKNIHSFLKPGGKSIVLIKPQFEAGKERLGKNGIVKPEMALIVVQEVLDWFSHEGYQVEQKIQSPITGKDGNIEFLVLIS